VPSRLNATPSTVLSFSDGQRPRLALGPETVDGVAAAAAAAPLVPPRFLPWSIDVTLI
jgi:hypothetical protein